MKLFRHIIFVLTALILASCAMDEFWPGTNNTEGEEVVMTFKTAFEDFETATKAIGDGTQVNTLLVHVYEGKSDTPHEYIYDISEAKVQSKVSIPFFYGKSYKVYFFAYKAGKGTVYKIADNGLKGGVTVTYPTESLGFDALEVLDAFYAVKDVNLSANVETSVSLTRPFAQVNLTANKAQLLAAKATKVEIAVKVATSYDFLDGPVGDYTDLKFTFEAADYFQNNDVISEDAAYLGTTYLFAPTSADNLPATVTLYDEDENVLKGPSEVKIPLVSNNRTNLVFSGIEPAGPSWDDNEVKVPGADADGWIHITRPEQFAAFLLNSTADGAKVCIDNEIDMSEIPEEVATKLAKASKSVKSLTLNGNNKTVSGLKLSAFFNEATNLTVYDLTLSGITVEGTSHVGVLVNTLKGKSSFNNVNVLNSSAATTNGAAGGMVGYIVRKSATDRSESMPIGFKNCQVISTSASGKESAGMFVGKFSGYDNGETLTFTDCSTSEASASADNASPYVEGNEGAWLADTNFTEFNSWLGDEAYYRGVVTFGGVRFQPKWDGTTAVEPFFDDQAKKGVQIYSPFDLAWIQGSKALTTLTLNTNIDMTGICEDCRIARANPCSESLYLNTSGHLCPSCPDELVNCSCCKYFTPIEQINNIYGNNYAIYNLNIQQQHSQGNSWGAGFINRLNSGTIENISFYGAYVKCVDVQDLRNNTQKGGNAYAGTLASRTNEGCNISINNVHAYNGYITAVSKMGGLLGYVCGSISADGCSVNDYVIENNKINVKNTYSKQVSYSNIFTASVSAEFYTEGEAGGFIGFITSADCIIKDCKTTGIIMRCYGQDNQTKKISGKFMGFIPVSYNYNIAGRHVNAFIGDIRTQNGETITINNCSSSYSCSDGYDYDVNSKGKGEIIGCCYIVGISGIVGDTKGEVKVDGESMGFTGD